MRIRKLNKKSFSNFNILLLSISVVLLVSCILHRYQLIKYPELYTQSILIDVEMISLLLLLILNTLNSIKLLRTIIRKKFREIWVVIWIGTFSIVSIIISLVIDASTLIYLT